MLFAVIFADHPEKGNLRGEFLPDHIKWLDHHRSTILVAGSLREKPEDVAKGGLWIVEAGSKVEVQELLESDPFFMRGLRASVDILHWNKAFPGRKSPI
jgi:uncharacterized protein YciI